MNNILLAVLAILLLPLAVFLIQLVALGILNLVLWPFEAWEERQLRNDWDKIISEIEARHNGGAQ